MRVVRVGVAVAAFLVNSLGAQSLPATAEQPVAPSTTASRALPPPAHTTDRMDLPVPPGAFHASDYARLPTAMRDLPFIAGTAGNDVGQTNALRNLAYEAVLARDFDSLNEVEAYLRTSRSRLSGGTSELTAFLGGVTRALRGLEDDFAPCTLKGIDFVKAWAAKDPRQPGAYLTEAELRLDYAWCFRGSGVASTVTADAWLRFHENINAAYRTLTEHADVARIDPGYYQIMEQIYRAQGRRALISNACLMKRVRASRTTTTSISMLLITHSRNGVGAGRKWIGSLVMRWNTPRSAMVMALTHASIGISIAVAAG